MRIRRSVRIIGVLAAMVLIIGQATMVDASNPVRWGSKLTSTVQPQNYDRSCDPDINAPNPLFTWMFRHVYHRTGGETAPKDGYIDKVRLIACSPGSFYLQFGKVREDPSHPGEYQAKIRTTSSKVSFLGDSDGCGVSGHYDVETIDIHDIKVYKGEYFGIKAKYPKALRCNSGSPNVLEFVPPLANGSSYTDPNDTNGCDPLIELQYQ